MISKSIVRISRAILSRDGEILFLKQQKSRGGRYTLPGGKVSRKEDIKKTLVRELEEETGIVIDERNLELVLTQRIKKPLFEMAIHFFYVQEWKGEPTNREKHKFSKCEWKTWPLKEQKTTASVRKAMNAFYDNQNQKPGLKFYF